MKGRLVSLGVYTLASVLGVIAFLYPFWLPSVQQGSGSGIAHAGDAPLILSLLVGLCFAVLLLEVQSEAMSAKTVALVGILVAINSVLRFLDAAVPGPGGFSPIFVLILLGGYVFGARVGFLLGALTLFVSALITGGMGPWLPYQMFTAGWMGMSAPLLRPVARALGWEARQGEAVLLAFLGGLWGLLFGLIMNIWFWPFVAGSADQYWTPGIGLWATLQRYAVFYVATSLVWDLLRLVGNVGLILLLGRPLLRVLARFQRRFAFVYDPTPAAAHVESGARAAGYRREPAGELPWGGRL
jgi:energy-coupling factor transport system substrate-specific component